jgi:Chalcone isomerase-like
MVRTRLLALALLGLFGTAALAVETVGVDGSETQYPTLIESPINKKPVRLVLTGTAMRKKLLFNVYTVASYIQEGAPARTADDVAAADLPKQLHLVMERDVDGKTMASAFRDAVRLNYPAPAFAKELDTLARVLEENPVKRGDDVWLTHVPGLGFHLRLAGKKEVVIPNSAFSKAIWEVYLGKNNLGESIKAGLTSRLQ